MGTYRTRTIAYSRVSFRMTLSDLESCLTTSGVPIADVIVAFCSCTHSDFFMIQKLSWGLFLPPNTIYLRVDEAVSAERLLI